MKHGIIMSTFSRNSPLQLSFIIVQGFLVRLCDSHHFSSCPFKLLLVSSQPRVLQYLPPTLLLNVYARSVARPQPLRSLPLFSPLAVLPPRSLLYRLSIVGETVAQTNARGGGGYSIRWCTARLERKNGNETAEGRKTHRLISG